MKKAKKNKKIRHKKTDEIQKLNDKKDDIAEEIKLLKKEYREQKTGAKTQTTNAERQREFEQKNKDMGLKKVTFWLPKEDIELINLEQKTFQNKHDCAMNKSEIVTDIFMKYRGFRSIGF